MVSDLLGAVAELVIRALNALIAALAAAVSALLSILPNMPGLPDPPAALVTAEGWVAWAFPVGTVLQILTFTLAVFLLWQVVAIVLRWAKALS